MMSAHLAAGLLYVIDLRTNQVVKAISDAPGAECVEFVPELKKVYTSNAGDNTIGVIDLWMTARTHSTCWNRREISRDRINRKLRRVRKTARGRLAHKSVPWAVRCEEVGGILRISFQFLPELQDVVIDCPHRRIVAVTQCFF